MADLSKFKDNVALGEAYCALEKEFTRKCQRIGELERALKAGTMERSSTPENSETYAETDCAGNPPQSADEIRPCPDADSGNPGLTAGTAERKEVSADAEDEALLLGRILSDSGLTAKIVAEYVKGLGQPQTPKIMGSGGGRFCLVPPKKPKTVREASVMAEKFLFRM